MPTGCPGLLRGQSCPWGPWVSCPWDARVSDEDSHARGVPVMVGAWHGPSCSAWESEPGEMQGDLPLGQATRADQAPAGPCRALTQLLAWQEGVQQ